MIIDCNDACVQQNILLSDGLWHLENAKISSI